MWSWGFQYILLEFFGLRVLIEHTVLIPNFGLIVSYWLSHFTNNQRHITGFIIVHKDNFPINNTKSKGEKTLYLKSNEAQCIYFVFSPTSRAWYILRNMCWTSQKVMGNPCRNHWDQKWEWKSFPTVSIYNYIASRLFFSKFNSIFP